MSVKICYPNYLDSERYSSLTASSANASYPVTNLEGTKRRSKVWQSAGYFLVTSANKVIRFRDASGGADKDATIVEGAYTSIAALITAIDTAFEAVGLANYTVTHTTDKKFKIESDLSGGATHFELRGADAAFTARDMLGFSASNQSGASSYEAVEVRCHTEEFITIDLGSAFNPKAFALFGPRNEPIRISQTATIKLQGNATDTWASPAYDATLTWNEFAIWKFGATGIHSGGLRYWRISISDRTNARGYVEISSLFLGDILSITTGCPQFPLSVTEIDLTQSERAISGGNFSSVYGKTSEVTLEWQFLTKTEMEAIRDMFTEVGIGFPFVVALDPNEAYSSDLERWVLQVKFQDAPSFALDRPNQFSTEWLLAEEV